MSVLKLRAIPWSSGARGSVSENLIGAGTQGDIELIFMLPWHVEYKYLIITIYMSPYLAFAAIALVDMVIKMI